MGTNRTNGVYHGSIAIRTDDNGKTELYISFSNVGEKRLCEEETKKRIREIQALLSKNSFEIRQGPLEDNGGVCSFILCEPDDPDLVEEEVLDIHDHLLNYAELNLAHSIVREKDKPDVPTVPRMPERFIRSVADHFN